MPDKLGRTAVKVPEETMEKVREYQQRLLAEGIRLTQGLVAVHLMEAGYAAKTQNALCDVSSGAQ